jgi:hypothetical protein
LVKREWSEGDVSRQMLKLDKHDLLKDLHLSATRVAIWKNSGKTFSAETHTTARMMGYE